MDRDAGRWPQSSIRTCRCTGAITRAPERPAHACGVGCEVQPAGHTPLSPLSSPTPIAQGRVDPPDCPGPVQCSPPHLHGPKSRPAPPGDLRWFPYISLQPLRYCPRPFGKPPSFTIQPARKQWMRLRVAYALAKPPRLPRPSPRHSCRPLEVACPQERLSFFGKRNACVGFHS